MGGEKNSSICQKRTGYRFGAHGTLGMYKIMMELAFDTVAPKAVGTYYYNRNGSDNRMIVYGDMLEGDSLVLKAYDTKFYDKPGETMVLSASGLLYWSNSSVAWRKSSSMASRSL